MTLCFAHSASVFSWRTQTMPVSRQHLPLFPQFGEVLALFRGGGGQMRDSRFRTLSPLSLIFTLPESDPHPCSTLTHILVPATPCAGAEPIHFGHEVFGITCIWTEAVLVAETDYMNQSDLTQPFRLSCSIRSAPPPPPPPHPIPQSMKRPCMEDPCPCSCCQGFALPLSPPVDLTSAHCCCTQHNRKVPNIM